jgi:hypothetical protein
MTLPRHPSRHVHATVFNLVKSGLTTLGWVNSPVNFSTTPVTFLDFQPEERGVDIVANTIAVSLGDVEDDVLGQVGGGLWSRRYPIFIDVYGVHLPITEAICDDVRDLLPEPGAAFALVDQTTGLDVAGADLEIEFLFGPERPAVAGTFDGLKRNWRIMRLQVALTFS